MTQVSCSCGGSISDTTDYCPYVFKLFPEAKLEQLCEQVEKKSSVDIADVVFSGLEFIYSIGLKVYMCPECSRLIIFGENKNGEKTRVIYKSEKGLLDDLL